MKLASIYENILRALSVFPDEQGRLLYHGLTTQVPWTLSRDDPRQIVLPTKDVLRAGDFTNVAPWHPLSEHLNRGVSPIMRATVRAANLRLTEVLLNLMEQFIDLGQNPERQLKMAPSAQKVLSVVKNVDERSRKDFLRIVSKMSDNKVADLSPITFYLKREGLYKGQRGRVCMVSSPLLNAISDSERKPGGVSIRINDQTMLEDLIDYILPGIDDTETYSSPSTSKLAPYFDSFLNAYEKVATQINRVIHVNRKELVDVEKLKINLDWGDLAEDLQTHRSEIPPLEDSKGKQLDSENADAAGVEAPAPAVPAPALYGSAPKPAPAAAPVAPKASDDDGLSLAERMRRHAASQAHPVMPPPGYPMAAPPAPYGAPGYPQAPQGYPVAPPPGYPMAPPPGYPGMVAPGGYPMAGAPVFPGQPAPAPTYHRQPTPPMPMGYPGQPMVDPSAPPWMGQTSSSFVAASTPPPAAPMQYPGQYPNAAMAPGMYNPAMPYQGTPIAANPQPAYNR